MNTSALIETTRRAYYDLDTVGGELVAQYNAADAVGRPYDKDQEQRRLVLIGDALNALYALFDEEAVTLDKQEAAALADGSLAPDWKHRPSVVTPATHSHECEAPTPKENQA